MFRGLQSVGPSPRESRSHFGALFTRTRHKFRAGGDNSKQPPDIFCHWPRVTSKKMRSPCGRHRPSLKLRPRRPFFVRDYHTAVLDPWWRMAVKHWLKATNNLLCWVRAPFFYSYNLGFIIHYYVINSAVFVSDPNAIFVHSKFYL